MSQPGFIDFWGDFAPVFDSLVPPSTVDRGFPEALRSLAGKTDPVVLDLACGAGRHTIPLLAAGIEVHSWDIDELSLHTLRARAAERGLSASTRTVDFLSGAPAAQHGDFDVVMSLGSTIIMMDPAAQAAWLARMARLTEPGGTVIVDTHHRPFIEALHAGGPRRDIEMGSYQDHPVSARAEWNPATDRWTLTYRYRSGGLEHTALELATIPTESALLRMAADAGLVPDRSFADWSTFDSAPDARSMTYVFHTAPIPIGEAHVHP